MKEGFQGAESEQMLLIGRTVALTFGFHNVKGLVDLIKKYFPGVVE